MQGTGVRCLRREDPLRKEMVTHSSTLACKIPQTEEPGGLRSMALKSRTRLGDHTTGAELTIPLRHYETSREDHSPTGGPGMAGPCTWLNRALQTLTRSPSGSMTSVQICALCVTHTIYGALPMCQCCTSWLQAHTAHEEPQLRPGSGQQLIPRLPADHLSVTEHLPSCFRQTSLILMLTQPYRQGMRIPRSEMWQWLAQRHPALR